MYLVFYSKNASPCIKEFKTLSAAKRFANKHEKLNIGQYTDDWVDCIVEGKIIETYKNWYGKPVKVKE